MDAVFDHRGGGEVSTVTHFHSFSLRKVALEWLFTNHCVLFSAGICDHASTGYCHIIVAATTTPGTRLTRRRL